MAMTPDEIDALPSYSASQQLKLWQRASIELASEGVTMAINGRQLTRADGAEVREQINYWQEIVSAESGNGGAGTGDVLVNFGNNS